MTKARDLANAARLLDNVTATQLGYISGVTSAVQPQIDSKASLSSPTLSNPTINLVSASINDLFQLNADTVVNPSAGDANRIFIEGYSAQLPSTFAGDGPVAATQATITSPAGLSGYTFTANSIYISNYAQPSSVTLTLNNPTTQSTADLASWASNAAMTYPVVTVAYVIPGTTTSVASTEISYIDGVTSPIQTQLDAKQPIVSGVDDTEIGYLNGVTSAIQTQLDSKVNLLQTVSTPTFTSNAYTLLSTDKDKVVLLSNGSTAGTVTIPTGVYSAGTVLTLVQTGTGQITIASGGTLNSHGNRLKFNGQWASCQAIVTATNTFLLIGNLTV